ncbi:polysaccharide deacetylase family protein [Kurthia sibirica]|uniref:polysaccharide deacetylase family protein n=1 Tax=Kurthia sibirica TaxID=202750 RepID=UPI0011696E08|nr:polysaccharide deacetylase family protein [Kurthia sibirica]GEK34781.1 hypothetical protein KSI01_23140 [Kurthia sibirica]
MKTSWKVITTGLIVLAIIVGGIIGFKVEQQQAVLTESTEVAPVVKEPSKIVAPRNDKQHYQRQATHKNPLPKNEKIVYLTFDDGPSEYTAKLTEILAQHNIQATFFMQGVNLKNKKFTKAVKQASQEGHYIGAHSMTHNYNSLYVQKNFVAEMNETIQLIKSITSKDHRLVRAPYGSAPGLQNKELLNEVVSAKLKVWDWNIDSMDWARNATPESILSTIKSETTQNTEVVLMHEKAVTVDTLPRIIQFFKSQGYSFEVYGTYDHFPMNFAHSKKI